MAGTKKRLCVRTKKLPTLRLGKTEETTPTDPQQSSHDPANLTGNVPIPFQGAIATNPATSIASVTRQEQDIEASADTKPGARDPPPYELAQQPTHAPTDDTQTNRHRLRLADPAKQTYEVQSAAIPHADPTSDRSCPSTFQELPLATSGSV
jgi:hypothetical protein